MKLLKYQKVNCRRKCIGRFVQKHDPCGVTHLFQMRGANACELREARY